ncbi:MAG: hypothetical protein FJ241_07305 [Nitrospira sp.]|nr:hypothetical protein [Nitrospira sp.]
MKKTYCIAKQNMIKIIILLLLFFLPLISAHAKELTLKECIDLALKNNGSLKSSETNVLSTEQDVQISNTGFFPSLKLKGNYTLLDKPDIFVVNRDTFGPGVPSGDVELSSENRIMYGISFIVEQPLFTGGNLTHSFRKSKSVNEEAHWIVERQRKLIIFEIKKSFYEILNEQLNQETLEKVTEANKERLRIFRDLGGEGYLQKDDVLQMETDITFTELELYKSKNKTDLALSKLKRLMYYQGDDVLSLKGSPRNGIFTASLQQIKESVLKNREELKMSLSRIKMSEADIEIAKSGFYPKAFLQGRYSLQRETNVTRSQIWMITTQIDWPIFEWGRTQSEVKKTEVIRQKLRYEHEEIEKEIMLEVEGLFKSVQDREKIVKAHEKKLKAVEYRLHIVMNRYAEGTAKLIDVIERESELIKAYNEYIIAINDLNIELARLDASTSGIKDEWLILEEIYKPDFDALSKTLKELITNKHDAIKPQKEPKVDEHQKDKNLEIFKQSQSVLTEPVIVQIGAFMSKQNAERVKDDLLKRVGDKKIEILYNRKLYHVSITGFKDKGEATDMARALGIKDYIILNNAVNH